MKRFFRFFGETNDEKVEQKPVNLSVTSNVPKTKYISRNTKYGLCNTLDI